MRRAIPLILTLSFAILTFAGDNSSQTGEAMLVEPEINLPIPLEMVASETIGRHNSMYHIDADAHTASNPTQTYDIQFREDGVTIVDGEDTWQLSLSAYGYDEALSPVGQPMMDVIANRTTYHHDILDEWYVNGQMGLQQGFTLHQRPSYEQTGNLMLALQMSGTMRATLQDETLHLQGEHGADLTYGGLFAYDANGQTLPAHFSLRGNELAILVDDTDAAYPITIDPWVQQAKLTASDRGGNDDFGATVAMSGDTALIGAPIDDDNGYASGSAYVFTRTGTLWTQQAKLLPDDGATYNVFGGSVALDGDTALIGAYGDTCATGEWCGSVYVFTRSGTTWTQQARLTGADTEEYDYFGNSVALDGDTALIGAYSANCAVGFQCGNAYVFTGSGASWTQQAKLSASDPDEHDAFGNTVELEGDTAIIGATGDKCAAGNSCGSAYVFTRSGTTWSQQAKLVPSNRTYRGWFGISVALDGDTAVIGASGDDSVYVFTGSGASWSQQARLTSIESTIGRDRFGSSVALSGDTALIGAYGDDDNGTLSGGVYIFTRSGTLWSQVEKLLPIDGASGDGFGEAVAFDGDTVLIGAFGDDCPAGDACGSVYSFGFVPTDTVPLNVTAACNGPNLEVNISAGDGPFDIMVSAGINAPVWGTGMGITPISGPEKWDDVTVYETTGLESIYLGKFRCRTDERPLLLSPANQSHTTNPFPLFSWTPITDASNYRVFVFDDKVAANRTVDIRENSGGPTSMTLSTPLPDGRLFWRARGRQNRVWSLWSVRFTLFKDPVVPIGPGTPIPALDIAPPNDRSTPLPMPTSEPVETPMLPAPPNSR